MAKLLKICKAEPAYEEAAELRRRWVEQQRRKMSEGENKTSPEWFAKYLAVTLKTPKAEPGSISLPGSKVESVEQLERPQGEMKTSPKCVLGPNSVNLSSSSEEEASKDSESENSAGASSDDSDRSDSGEEEYKMCSEDEDEEEEEGPPPRAKKAKITSGLTTVKSDEELPGKQVKRKSRVKITPMRADSRSIKPRNSNPGRRRVGKRIYDSVLGRTCHWCRQKTVELHVECASCPIRFCGACLQNRNGENVELEMLVRWICPKCRGGCGPGCANCCNCGPCRKAQGFGPTGQLVQMARRVGFNNVHDYLVHLDTQEGPEEITLRKKGKKWTRDSGARVHPSMLKKHTVKEEVEEEEEEEEEDDDDDEEEEEEDVKNEMVDDDEEEEEEDVKNEMAEEAELYRKSRERRGEAKVKDEPVLAYDKPRKEKICDEPRMKKIVDDPGMESSDQKTFSACHVSESRCKPTNSPVQTSISDNPSEDIWLEKSSQDSVSHRGNSSCVQESDFGSLLNTTLERPFSMHQMKEMWGHLNFRKPVMKLRQTRSRAIEVPGSVEGLSYLDHYPDLEEKLAKAKPAEEKLRLMRGFFFWLQRSCMEGAYRPWRNAPTIDDSGDCTEISGPDCEIIRVLFAVGEDEENAPLEWEDKKPTIRPADVKKFLSPKQSVSRFPVRVKQEKEN